MRQSLLESPCIKVIDALSMATSVPVPMAMPTSAVARAIASLIHTAMATTRPASLASEHPPPYAGVVSAIILNPYLLGNSLGRPLLVPGKHIALTPSASNP